MAIFDFPRIHFKGELEVNVATINNAATFPLTIYDATRSRPFLPPRLYFSSAAIIQGVSPSINPTIHQDEVNGFFYIEINPINTIELLRTWCMTPLCTDPALPDMPYKPYYQAAEKDEALQPHLELVGQCPGYWNMYGDMSVTMKNMLTAGLQMCTKNENTGQYDLQFYAPGAPDLPPGLQPLMEATVDFDVQPQNGLSTASMCETVSNQSVFAYIFCNTVNVTARGKPDQVLFQGEPFRFQPMLYGTWKVFNWIPPMAASCRYTAAIPIVGRSPQWLSPIGQFIMLNRPDPSRPVKGLLVSFTIEQVFEYRYNPNYYLENGKTPNPVKCTSVCSISPWYEGDMRTGVLGRYLVAQGCENVLDTPIPIQFTPALSKLTPLPDGTAIYSLDMGNTWPEAMVPPPANRKSTPDRHAVSFATYDLGPLSLRHGAGPETEFATIAITQAGNPLDEVMSKGSFFDWHISDPQTLQNLQNNFLQIYLNEKKVLTESPYYITSDQKGLYANQGDAPSIGYIAYSQYREACRLRILSRGVPVTEALPLIMARWDAPEAGNDPMSVPDQCQVVSLKDNDVVPLSPAQLELANNAIYYFAYPGQYPNDSIPAFADDAGNYTIFDTGAFVVMRVHPHRDYSKYLDKANWGTTPPDWKVVYEEVFKLYDVVYPIMSEIHPWKEEIWNNGYMAGLVLQRTKLNIWEKVTYMPKTRELSQAQRDLLHAWAAYLKTINT